MAKAIGATITDSDEILNAHEAAAFLKIKVSTLYGWVHERRIPFRKAAGGTLLRFLKRELLAWLNCAPGMSQEELTSAEPSVNTRSSSLKIRRKCTSATSKKEVEDGDIE